MKIISFMHISEIFHPIVLMIKTLARIVGYDYKSCLLVNEICMMIDLEMSARSVQEASSTDVGRRSLAAGEDWERWSISQEASRPKHSYSPGLLEDAGCGPIKA